MIAYTSLPTVSLRRSADSLVIIATTSSPLASSTVTSVLTAPGRTRLTLPFSELRALISIVYALPLNITPKGANVYPLFAHARHKIPQPLSKISQGRQKNLWRNRIKPYMHAHILLQESASTV